VSSYGTRGGRTKYVLAGYIGDKPAAPILLEMLEEQEGLAGGYYTGLATLDAGRLHFRKVVGDAARLKAETDALSLPRRVEWEMRSRQLGLSRRQIR
jgi:hypothetical protein